MSSLREALLCGRKVLREAAVENGDADAWYLLEHVCGIDRNTYILHMDDCMEAGQEQCYRALLNRRAQHVPLQLLTGHAYFMGLEFEVNEHVLIPRQDTEILAETALDVMREGDRILDLCTGSGCILISLMVLGKPAQGTGADISGEALATAQRNAQRLCPDAEFIRSDLFSRIEGTFDIIVTNPPYIRTDVIGGLMEEVRLYEPRTALDGGADGLYYYREIIASAPAYLTENGRIGMEIGYDQAASVTELLVSAGYREIRTVKDLAGLDRVVWAVRPV